MKTLHLLLAVALSIAAESSFGQVGVNTLPLAKSAPTVDEVSAMSDSVRSGSSAAISSVPQFSDADARLRYLRWLGAMSERLKKKMPDSDSEARKQFLEKVWYQSMRQGLRTDLTLGLIEGLSDFKNFAEHDTGARGYMQVAPYWVRLVGDGDPSKLFDTGTNLLFGTVILRHYLDKHKGDLDLALTDYVEVNFHLAGNGTEADRLARMIRSRAMNWQTDNKKDVVTKGTARIAMKKSRGTFVVPVHINDAISLDFIVDSGAADVSVPADVFSTLVRTGTIGKADITGSATYVLADGSTSRSITFIIRSLKVGGVVLRNVAGSVAPTKGSLLLGQSFLNRFKTWSIDNAKNELVLD